MSGRPKRRNNRLSGYAQQQQQQLHQNHQNRSLHHQPNQNLPHMQGSLPKEEPSAQLHDEADLISFRSDALVRFISNQEYLENVTSKYIHSSKIIPPSSFPPKNQHNTLDQLSQDEVYFGTLPLMQDKVKRLKTDMEAVDRIVANEGYFLEGESREEYAFQHQKIKELSQLLAGVNSEKSLLELEGEFKRIGEKLEGKFGKKYEARPSYKKLSAKFDVTVARAPADYDPKKVGSLIALQKAKQERERQEQAERERKEREEREEREKREREERARIEQERREQERREMEERLRKEKEEQEQRAQAQAQAQAEAQRAQAEAQVQAQQKAQELAEQQAQQQAQTQTGQVQAQGTSGDAPYQGSGMDFMNDFDNRNIYPGANVGVSAAGGPPEVSSDSGFAMMVNNGGGKVGDDDLDNIFDEGNEVLASNPIMNDDMDNLINFQGDEEDLIGDGSFDQDFLSQIDHSIE